MSDTLKPLIGAAADRPLSRAEAETAFNVLFEGEATPSQVGGFLMALRTRGAAGVPVAKHGNRNLSSKSGAADALGQLGINVMVGPDVVEPALKDVGICFMMAPMHHPAMKHVMPSRAELGTRTIFNILGPLTTPAGAKRQLTGAFAIALIFPMAETLHQLVTQ